MMVIDWLRSLRRARAFPDAPARPVRVDVVGKVTSPNTVTSPITWLDGSVIEIALVDREIVMPDRYNPNEQESWTTLGAMRYGGDLAITDDAGRTLVIQQGVACRVVPLSMRPMNLDTPVPPDLEEAAARSEHILAYREVRFRSGDRVRVVATVRQGRIAALAGGYRDATDVVLVPIDGERVELHEML